VADCCEFGDEPSVSGTTESVVPTYAISRDYF
jgi:hypothetical protein